MQLISEDKINEIRNKADIVSIISDYIPLKMQGKNYFGICPFHDDHTPSMSVSKERQLFKCFVCNKGGNVFTFVKDYENITYLEAVKKVANIVGIPFLYTETKKVNNENKKYYDIMEFATKIFQNNLNSKEGKKAKEYLEQRQINEEVIKEFKIGYAIDNHTYLYNVLTKKGYSLNDLDLLGLANKNGLEGYDAFVNRIIIPITNLDGEVVGFTGRIFNGESAPKYVNSKETIIYKKGNILFNYSNAKNYIREKKSVILVEGNMDAIRMYSSGIKNVVALMGTALTKEQIDIFKKLRVPVILMLDSDKAGFIATNNIGDMLTKDKIECKVVRLNGAKDPDEYIVKFGIEAFNNAINHSINYFDYKLSVLKENKNLNNTEELVSYIKNVLKLIENEDNLTKEITLKKLSNEYNIDYEILKKEINLEKSSPPEKVKDKSKEKIIIKDKYKMCAYNVLYYLMSDVKYLDTYYKKLGFLKKEEERNLVTEIDYYIKKYNTICLADFLTYAESDDKIRNLVNNIIETVNIQTLDEEIFIGYLKAIDAILKKENIKAIKDKISMSTDINEQIENLNRQIAMKKIMLEGKKEV